MKMSTKYNQYAARISKGIGVGWGVWQSKFPHPGAGGSCPIWTHLDRQKKGGEGAKIGHFSWMS